MTLSISELAKLETKLDLAISKISHKEDLEMLRRDWLAKEGIIRSLFKELKEVSESERALVAEKLNALRSKVERYIEDREAEIALELRKQRLGSEFFDLSLPAAATGFGAIHPLTYIERKWTALLKPFGFKNVIGPEIETEYYCFDALNIPKHHPARDMQDTFYTNTGHLLRTHTSSIQARALEKGGLPVKITCCGRVYRNETEDASHQAMFGQFDIIWLEKGLTLSHLMGLLNHILKELYGRNRKVRFVPKFYPYTEPSIGPQIDCALCKGKGCTFCGDVGWVTVGGAGMIHRNVLLEFKYNPDEVTGFAFGMGTDRMAAQHFNLPNLKSLYDGDLRIFKTAT